MARNPKTHTSLHILKGAVQKILGATLTTGVHEENEKGLLTVAFDRKPTDEEMKQVQDEVDKKIEENVPIEIFEMDRSEAEEKFGERIYDKFIVPPHITKLKIAQIKDWNINCCACGHTQTTGEVGKIKITKFKFRNAKQQLEISFLVE
ncbi:MAG: alanyl-tRNA editing protein [Candidatus Woesearchaeota archaeon]